MTIFWTLISPFIQAHSPVKSELCPRFYSLGSSWFSLVWFELVNFLIEYHLDPVNLSIFILACLLDCLSRVPSLSLSPGTTPPLFRPPTRPPHHDGLNDNDTNNCRLFYVPRPFAGPNWQPIAVIAARYCWLSAQILAAFGRHSHLQPGQHSSLSWGIPFQTTGQPCGSTNHWDLLLLITVAIEHIFTSAVVINVLYHGRLPLPTAMPMLPDPLHPPCRHSGTLEPNNGLVGRYVSEPTLPDPTHLLLIDSIWFVSTKFDHSVFIFFPVSDDSSYIFWSSSLIFMHIT